MKFVVRIALGAALGLATVGGLSIFLHKWWLVGLVGAVTGVVAFLGSFFLWTADRPQDGYEQVLFDVTNSATCLALVVIMVAAAFGGGALLSKSSDGPSIAPADAAAVASMGVQRQALHGVLVAYLKEPKSGKLTEWKSTANAASVAIAKLSAPERSASLLAELSAESKSLDTALAAQAKCDKGDTGACVDARIAASDAQRADSKYGEEAAALGV